MWFEYSLKILHQWAWCTLYNPTSRLATGHRSAQRPYGAPREGGALENGWKQWGRRSGGVTDASPPHPMKGRFHALWEAERTERGNTLNLRACECVLPCCVSLCNPECVGVTGSVGLSHWKVSNVFVWSRGGISSRTMHGSNPCFSIPSSFSFYPPFPATQWGSFSFCCFLFVFTTVRESWITMKGTDLNRKRLSENRENL